MNFKGNKYIYVYLCIYDNDLLFYFCIVSFDLIVFDDRIKFEY